MMRRASSTGDPVVGRVAECLVLRVVPAGAETEDEAAAGDGIGSRGNLLEQGRIAEGHTYDERAHLDAGRGGCEGERIVHPSWIPSGD